MVLTELLGGIRVIKLFSSMYGKMLLTQDVSIRSIQYDSRRVERNDMFVAIRGTAIDGNRFVGDAIERGATVVVTDEDGAVPDTLFMHAGVIKVLVHDARIALAILAANLYGHPSRRMTLIGVTGTNGKTTTTHLIKSILEAGGKMTGLIGTIEYKIGDMTIPATHTTPESLELNRLLASMAEKGCSSAVMEVSSHSLAMNRVHGLEFQAGVFTNLTQDHLDFHGSMDAYFRAKKILFDGLAPSAWAVLNADDPYSARMADGITARSIRFGSGQEAEITARDVTMTVQGTRMNVVTNSGTQPIASSLTGQFNVSNILAAYATGAALGIPAATIASGIAAVTSVRGRFEQIVSPTGWTAVVDYAHTPDALDNCLRTIRDLLPAGGKSRVITVFGCGGDRDRGKRPVMGHIATQMSDVTIVTSDNPRKEEPQSIIDEVFRGVVPGSTAYREVDRRRAIAQALGLAKSGDVVLIAGKGHEDYQVIGEMKSHFDDREEVEAFIRAER